MKCTRFSPKVWQLSENPEVRVISPQTSVQALKLKQTIKHIRTNKQNSYACAWEFLISKFECYPRFLPAWSFTFNFVLRKFKLLTRSQWLNHLNLESRLVFEFWGDLKSAETIIIFILCYENWISLGQFLKINFNSRTNAALFAYTLLELAAKIFKLRTWCSEHRLNKVMDWPFCINLALCEQKSNLGID